MKVASSFLAATAMVAVLALAGPADGATVVCNGLESGGQGPTLYRYEVTLGANEWMQDFQAGTDCLVPAHYGGFVQPAGWAPVLFGPSEPHADVKTPHGGLSPGPFGNCPASVAWSGPALGPGLWVFGYNNSHPSHDVGWTVTGLAAPNTENWAMPVGMGCWPVHGPIPEPMTLSVLALGACLPLLRKRR